VKSLVNACTRNEQIDVKVATKRYPDLGLRLPATEALDSCSASPASVAAFRPLCQDHAQLRVVFVLVVMVNTDMSLQIVRSGVAMLLVRAEWTAKSGSVRSS
jgi:hypothetical protein